VTEYVIGVDGGNSKTEVVIASTSGRLLARARGPGIDSPLQDLARWRHDLGAVVALARREAQVAVDSRAACAAYFLANVDLPAERRLANRELSGAGTAEVTVVHNDSVAVLRAGARRHWGVAVVAGAGINAVGVHPSGRIARFLALGDYTGDAGGGLHLGVKGLAAAVRARDGRGPATALTAAVPRHFGLRRPEDVAIAVHHKEIAYDELHVLAPVVFAAAAGGDPVARALLFDFGTEVAVMANAIIRRLHLTRTDVEVVLGGGILQAIDRELCGHITAAVTAVAPAAQVSVLRVPPVYGAVVEAVSRLGGPVGSLRKLHRELTRTANGALALD
jgi:N-acetylglucosamine kinase-like BadF-type ATPase